VDLWRTRGESDAAAAAVLSAYPGETFPVPTHAAGEFLEGGAAVSSARLGESLAFLRSFHVGEVDLETALRYARIVAHLRAASDLAGRSKPDLWIAASAIRWAARLVTRNVRHFGGIPGTRARRLRTCWQQRRQINRTTGAVTSSTCDMTKRTLPAWRDVAARSSLGTQEVGLLEEAIA
jgi:predicted nucleic acid-binding protein